MHNFCFVLVCTLEDAAKTCIYWTTRTEVLVYQETADCLARRNNPAELGNVASWVSAPRLATAPHHSGRYKHKVIKKTVFGFVSSSEVHFSTSKNLKIKIYKTIVLPVVLYECEA